MTCQGETPKLPQRVYTVEVEVWGGVRDGHFPPREGLGARCWPPPSQGGRAGAGGQYWVSADPVAATSSSWGELGRGSETPALPCMAFWVD